MKCRVCGCTDLEPCISAGGETCAWIEDDLEGDLCDFCDDGLAESESLVGLYTEGDLNQVIAERRLR